MEGVRFLWNTVKAWKCCIKKFDAEVLVLRHGSSSFQLKMSNAIYQTTKNVDRIIEGLWATSSHETTMFQVITAKTHIFH